MSLSICKLARDDRDAVESHLLRLAPVDRSLRFAAGVVTDETIRRHVQAMPFESDIVLGVRDGADVVALAHGCVYPAADGGTHVEVAFSVDAGLRRRGVGTALMAAARAGAEAIGAERIVAMCVARNLPMRRIFERSGMATSREEDEVHACCTLAGGGGGREALAA